MTEQEAQDKADPMMALVQALVAQNERLTEALTVALAHIK